MELTYASVLLKELVENWEELFGEGDYKVVSAKVEGNHLELQFKSSKWKRTFDCVLDSVGKLWYDRRPPRPDR